MQLEYLSELTKPIVDLQLPRNYSDEDANTYQTITMNEIMSLEMIFKRCNDENGISDEDLRKLDYSMGIGGVFTDFQCFYVFASKVLLSTYRLMYEYCLGYPGLLDKKCVADHGKFRQYLNDNKKTDGSLAKALYESVGWRYLNVYSQVIVKRNKIVEHWSDVKGVHSELFPYYMKMGNDNTVLHFMNKKLFNQWYSEDRKAKTLECIDIIAKKLKTSMEFSTDSALIVYGEVHYWEMDERTRLKWSDLMGTYESILPLVVNDKLLIEFKDLINGMLVVTKDFADTQSAIKKAQSQDNPG